MGLEPGRGVIRVLVLFLVRFDDQHAVFDGGDEIGTVAACPAIRLHPGGNPNPSAAPQQAHDVGEDRESGRQVRRQGGAAVARVAVGDRLAPLDPQGVEVLDKPPAVAGSGTAKGHLAGEAGQAAGAGLFDRKPHLQRDGTLRQLEIELVDMQLEASRRQSLEIVSQ